MVKHFLINPHSQESPKEDILELEEKRAKRVNDSREAKEIIAEQVFNEEDTLKHVYGRVVVKIDMEGKNYHRFEGGMTIRRERIYNNLNFRETSPVNATVISSDDIPKGVEILVDYHAVHDSNKIFNYKNKSPQIQYYSIKTNDCYLWRDKKEWLPMPPYELALRVFQKFDGVISWMKPEQMTDTLYVTTGKLKGNVVMTLKGCDYECVFQDTNGKEGNIIRFLPFGDERVKKEIEAIAILDELTEKVKRGTLLVGISVSDCKTLNEYYG
mgnify:CR=1 FL=1